MEVAMRCFVQFEMLENTLKIMLTAYQAAQLRTKAEKMLEKLKEEQ